MRSFQGVLPASLAIVRVAAAFAATGWPSRSAAQPAGAAATATAPGMPAPDAEERFQEREGFLKGELSQAGGTKLVTRNNRVGVPVGYARIAEVHYMTVSPELDLRFPAWNLAVGLGVPLELELFDERKVVDAANAQASMCDQHLQPGEELNRESIENNPALQGCLRKQLKQPDADPTLLVDAGTERMFELRKASWDERSDFAKVIRYVTLGREESNYYVSVNRLFAQNLGHGVLLRRYNPNLDVDTARVGATVDAHVGVAGFEFVANDVVAPNVVGGLLFLRPLHATADSVALRGLSLGFSYVTDLDAPLRLTRLPGDMETRYQLDPDTLDPVVATDRRTQALGIDLETKVLRTDTVDLKPYLDWSSIADAGWGATAGMLGRFSFGGDHGLRARLELQNHSSDYFPSYFDNLYEVHRLQFLPAGRQDVDEDGDGTADFRNVVPKRRALELLKGGPRYFGAYAELTYAVVDLISVGAALQLATPAGGEAEPMSKGARLRHSLGRNQLLLHMELPAIEMLRWFVTYQQSFFDEFGELFDTDDRKNNEVIYSGLRLQLLPFLYVNLEARHFFQMRTFELDLDSLATAAPADPETAIEEAFQETDHNFQTVWSYAGSVELGWEF